MGVEPVIMSAGELESERAGKLEVESFHKCFSLKAIKKQKIILFIFFFLCVSYQFLKMQSVMHISAVSFNFWPYIYAYIYVYTLSCGLS